MEWLRLYHDLIDDPKMLELSDGEFRHFITLLCYAGECNADGEIPFPLKNIAWRVRIDEYALRTTVEHLSNGHIHILEATKKGIRFLNWWKRQRKSDDKAVQKKKERVRKMSRDMSPTEQNRTEQNKTCTHFDRFWSAYPRKKSKGQALKAWKKIKPSEQLLETMLSAIERAKTSADWVKDGGQYIQYPATWLNAQGWEDEISKPQSEELHPI